MRIITNPNDQVPGHIILTDNPKDLGQIHRPEINLVACFLPPHRAFRHFSHSAYSQNAPSTYVLSHPPSGETPDPIGMQMDGVFNELSQRHHKIAGKRHVNHHIRRFIKNFCHVTEAEEVSARLFSDIGPRKDTRPHVDAVVEQRGLLDLSEIGMIAFDQTGLSVQQRRTISRACHNAADFEPAAAAYAEHDERVLLVKGPVALIFKGGQSDNPLLHAAVPPHMLTPAQKAVPFRPCWRLDSYYR